MPKLSLKTGSTSQTINVFIMDSASKTGAGKTGIAYNTSGLTAYYVRPREAAAAITLATQTATGAWSSGGFVEIDATNMPGFYRLDIPNAMLAVGVNCAEIMLQGASGMGPLILEIELTAWDNQDAVRGGMTALPNANAGDLGGLPLSVDSSGRVDILKINGTNQTARDIGSSVLLSSGTGEGQLDFTSGIVKADLAKILGTALTETAGQIAAGFKQFFNIDSPAGTMNMVADIKAKTDSYLNAPISAIPIHPLLDDDPRLDYLDAPISGISGISPEDFLDALLAGHTDAGTVGRALAWLLDAFVSDGVFSAAALANCAGSGGGGGGGTFGSPPPLAQAIINQDGTVSREWAIWFNKLFRAV